VCACACTCACACACQCACACACACVCVCACACVYSVYRYIQVLAQLDWLEDHPNLYQRRRVSIEGMEEDAWMYVLKSRDSLDCVRGMMWEHPGINCCCCFCTHTQTQHTHAHCTIPRGHAAWRLEGFCRGFFFAQALGCVWGGAGGKGTLGLLSSLFLRPSLRVCWGRG
jgi:hypothetical protein